MIRNPLRERQPPAATAEPAPATGAPAAPTAGAAAEADFTDRLQRLAADLRDRDACRVAAAADDLRAWGPAGAAVLLETLAGEDSPGPNGFLLLRTLADLGPQAVPALRQALRGPNERKQWLALAILGRLEPRTAEAVPELIRLAQAAESDRELRLDALRSHCGDRSAGARRHAGPARLVRTRRRR